MGSSYPGFVPLGAHYVSISSFRFFVSAAVFNNIVTVCAGSSWWLWHGRQGGGGLRQGAVGPRGEDAVDDNGAAEQGGRGADKSFWLFQIKQLYACQHGGTCDTAVV